MTREEVIKILEKSNTILANRINDLEEAVETVPSAMRGTAYRALVRCQKEHDAVAFAVEVLREQEEREESGPLTNADRIRAMSDEELAAFMFSMVDCISCENKLMNNGRLVFGDKRKTCTNEDYHAMCNGDGRKCEAVCLKWLQQPAEGGDQDGTD